jgi:S1-C subfamily serine protease
LLLCSRKELGGACPLRKFFSLLCLFAILGIAFAQNGVPFAFLRSTFLIKVGVIEGTAFAIQYRGRQYLITARHVVRGLPARDASIDYFRKGMWKALPVTVVTPKNPDVDIAVLVPSEDIASQEDARFAELTFKGARVGGDVYFFGYPYGLHSLNGSDIVPFVKKGAMSAIDGTDDSAVVLYVDAFNNEGFSGGPIAFFDAGSNTWKIAGVVQGYLPERAKVRVGRQNVDTNTLVNSGILVGYSIQHALEAIDEASKH